MEKKLSEAEIIKMYDKGIVEIAPIMEKLIENFKQDKNIIDIQQCQLIIHYLLVKRKFYEKYIDELEKKLDKEKEKNRKLKKQLNDIHSNFCKFNWQESNGKQVYNQLAELYESIYRKENKNE